jgi:RNA polymerase sigma factor (sigma-70 family)
MHAPAPKTEIKLSAEAWVTRLLVCNEWFYREFVYYDSRFRNTLTKPQPVKTDAKLPPGNKPAFDKGRFAASKGMADTRPGSGFKRPIQSTLSLQLSGPKGPSGASLSAAWEGGNADNPNAKITAKFGSTGYEKLLAEARKKIKLVPPMMTVTPGCLSLVELFPRLRIRHSSGHEAVLLPHIGREWFGGSYPERWDRAARCYSDIRIDGKATSDADLTWIQAGAREADEPTGCLSTRPGKREETPAYVSDDNAHAHAQEDDAALAAYLWDYRRLYDEAEEKPRILGIFFLWLAAGLRKEEKYGPYKPKPPPRHCNVYWHRENGHQVAKLVTLNELLSRKAIAESKKRDANPPPRRAVFLDPAAELELGIRGKAGDIEARNRIIAAHRPLVFQKTKGMPELRDIRQECMERLVTTAWKDWEPGRSRFATFAEQAIDWAIQDYLRKRRAQVPVRRSINANDPDDDEHQEAINMTNALYEARRRLIAERLDCLDGRERRVVEARLCLNGLAEPSTYDELAAELGTSATSVRRVEDDAVAKLQQAVAC